MDGEVVLFELEFELETWFFAKWLVRPQKLKTRLTVASARPSRSPFLAL